MAHTVNLYAINVIIAVLFERNLERLVVQIFLIFHIGTVRVTRSTTINERLLYS